MAAKGGLTVKKIERLVSAAKAGRYSDGHGLYLKIVNRDNVSWVFRYQRDGRERLMGLGALHTFSLDEARERARAARQLLDSGRDPIDDRDAETAKARAARASALTFKAAAEATVARLAAEWKNEKHKGQWTATLKAYAYPEIGELPVRDIDTPHILKVLEPIWLTKTETATRLRERIERILDWARVAGHRDDGPNPARWKGHLSQLLARPTKVKRVKHHSALPFAELPDFMTELRSREGVAARALEFTILTAARTGETIGARWPEIDLANRVWIVPPQRMKGRREHDATHRVPLSDRAVELLKALPREQGNDFVFIGPRTGAGLSNMAMAKVLARMGRDDITVHGFRSTFRDWGAELTHYPNEMLEMALAHTVSDKVEAAYRRGTMVAKRAALMRDWARFTATPYPKGGVVVTLRGGQ